MAEIILCDPNSMAGFEIRAIEKHITDNNLPQKEITATDASLLFTLIEQSPELLLVIVTNSKNTTPYGEIAREQRNNVIFQLEERRVPYEVIDDGNVLSPAVLAALAS